MDRLLPVWLIGMPDHEGQWPSDWCMQAQGCPKFSEYIMLAKANGWGDLVSPDVLNVGPTDGLVIVDMQNDFVPMDDLNPHGGAFAVSEGNLICPLIMRLAETFAKNGGLVAACKDYHPDDHCSFIPNGGDFPAHCIQARPGVPMSQGLRERHLQSPPLPVTFWKLVLGP